MAMMTMVWRVGDNWVGSEAGGRGGERVGGRDGEAYLLCERRVRSVCGRDAEALLPIERRVRKRLKEITPQNNVRSRRGALLSQ